MEVAKHVVGGGTLGRGWCGAQCRHCPGPLGLLDGDDAHNQLCRQDCRVRHWGACSHSWCSLWASKLCLPVFWVGWGPTLAWKFIPKSVLHERSLLVKHAAFEGPAERDTVCLTA